MLRRDPESQGKEEDEKRTEQCHGHARGQLSTARRTGLSESIHLDYRYLAIGVSCSPRLTPEITYQVSHKWLPENTSSTHRRRSRRLGVCGNHSIHRRPAPILPQLGILLSSRTPFLGGTWDIVMNQQLVYTNTLPPQ